MTPQEVDKNFKAIVKAVEEDNAQAAREPLLLLAKGLMICFLNIETSLQTIADELQGKR